MRLITLVCLFGMVIPVSVLNIIVYPISKKLSARISDYIVRVMAPRVFAILSMYRHFSFLGEKDNGAVLPKQFILVSNHQSLLDIPCFMNFFRDKDLRFITKAELGRHVPLVSEMLRSHEHCLIPRRASSVTAMRVVERFCQRVMERGQVPVIFPEGTRTKDGNVGKFYSAGFRKLIDETHLPVVVCALDGGWQIGNIKTLLTNLKNGSYRVKVVKVFYTLSTREDQTNALKEARSLIQNQLDDWRKDKKSATR